MKVIIWILGSLSSGKTTQNKLLQEHLGNRERQYLTGESGGIPYAYTKYGDICSLGDLNESVCCGLDRVTSRLKNEGIYNSLKEALSDCDIVVVESIMSASTWFDKLKEYDAKLFMVHIGVSFEENVRRLKIRQWKKDNPNHKGPNLELQDNIQGMVELSDANYEFIRKTRMQYQNIFDKFKDQCDSLSVECTNLKPKEVNNLIMKFIYSQL